MGHPNLANEVNNAIEASARADSIDLTLIGEGVTIRFKTKNTQYAFERLSNGMWLCVMGNEKFFKKGTTQVRIIGSTFGGSMIKVNTIFVGGYVEMVSDEWGGQVLTTSMVTSIGDGHSNQIH